MNANDLMNRMTTRIHFDATPVSIQTGHSHSHRSRDILSPLRDLSMILAGTFLEEKSDTIFPRIEDIPIRDENQAIPNNTQQLSSTSTPPICNVCKKEVIEPKVTLHCDCEYHLECFLLCCEEASSKKKKMKCLHCNDKIFKCSESDYENCAICLLPLKKDLKRLSNCSHRFHKDCIKQWGRTYNLANNRKCPVCRTSMTPPRTITTRTSVRNPDITDITDITDATDMLSSILRSTTVYQL